MKILTAAEMREVDRRTVEAGIPGIVLMENAGHRVVEFLAERFSPLGDQRIVVLCGKGNNGGDGLVVARQLHTRFLPASLHVVLFAEPGELKGDAAANLAMLLAAGGRVERGIPPEARAATLVVDALLGTGVSGAATGRMLQGIREINQGFPLAAVVAVDLPSGMPTDSGEPTGEFARADGTVTFTAPKPAHAMPPNCDNIGELMVGAIGSPPELYAGAWLELVEPAMFLELLAPRDPAGHKGAYGHVLVVAGSRGKTGAAAMAGLAALRAGAGLVTVASAESAIAEIASHAPELMTEPLPETESGSIALNADLVALARGKSVVAMGPGLGRAPQIAAMVSTMAATFEGPMVLDADALVAGLSSMTQRFGATAAPLAKKAGKNWLAGASACPTEGQQRGTDAFVCQPGDPGDSVTASEAVVSGTGTIPHRQRPAGATSRLRILTPHPGEMARLTGKTTAEVQADRIGAARTYAMGHGVTLVLKGQRTVIAFPDGRVWINPTGTPAMGKGGSGDILTGMIAGMVAQFPEQADQAVAAAVYLHGLAGQLGARTLGEKCLLATDLLQYLPDAMEDCGNLPHRE
jgi:NAD(P)H-hydrate epimerase